MLRPPTRIAPAASSLRTSAPSRRALGPSRLIFEPARVGRPSMSNRFLTANGTPDSGPRCWPASIWMARRRARSATISVKALTVGSAAAMRLSVASMTALAFTLPLDTERAISAAVACFERISVMAGCSRTIDRQRRQFLVELDRQQGLHDRERPFDVQDHVGAIFLGDRKTDRLRRLFDPLRDVWLHCVGLLAVRHRSPDPNMAETQGVCQAPRVLRLQSPSGLARRRGHEQRS